QCGAFPSGDYRPLHDGEISVEVSRSAEAVASLGEGHSASAARPSWARQVSSVKSGFASRLYEVCAQIRTSILVELRWLARLSGIHNSRIPAARQRVTNVCGGHGIDRAEIVVL